MMLGVVGEMHATDRIHVRARVTFGWLLPNYEMSDPSETVHVLRVQVGAEWRRDYAMWSLFVNGHVGVQRMTDGWIHDNGVDPTYGPIMGVQGGVETGTRRLRVRGALEISRWSGAGDDETDVGGLLSTMVAF